MSTPGVEAQAKKDVGPYYGEYDENGVDLTLLRYMLRMSPRERLLLMDQHARDTMRLYEYGRRHREDQA